MTNGKLLPALLAPLLLWRFYHRFKRNVGRQTAHTGRMVTLMSLMTIGLAALTYFTLHEPDALIAIWAGLVLGAVIGAIGLRLTRFENAPEGRFYTPNAYLGIAISMLLISRLAYRFFVLYSEAPTGPRHFFPFNKSPLTLMMLGVIVGYYIVYSGGVLMWFRTNRPNTAPADAPQNLPSSRQSDRS